MLINKYNPFTAISSSKSDRYMSSKEYFDKLIENTFNDFFSDLHFPYYTTPSDIEMIKQEDGSLLMQIDVPGMKQEDLVVEVVDNIINIRGERKTAKGHYSINKSWTISENYDISSLAANLADGVLTISLKSKPKIEVPIKRIEISTSPILSLPKETKEGDKIK